MGEHITATTTRASNTKLHPCKKRRATARPLRWIVGWLAGIVGILALVMSSIGTAAAQDDEFEAPTNIQNTSLVPNCLVVTWQHSSSGVANYTVTIDGGRPVTINDPYQFSKEFCSLEPGSMHRVEVCAVFGTDDADTACTETSLGTVKAEVGEMEPGGPLPTPRVDEPIPSSLNNFGVGWKGFHDYDFYFLNIRPEGGNVWHIKHEDDGDWGWQRVDELTPGTTYYFSVRGCVSGIFGDPCSGWSPEAKVTIDLPYGPDTCKQGFVWRDAVPGDHICVTPERRQKVADDNALASTRKPTQAPPSGEDLVNPPAGTGCPPAVLGKPRPSDFVSPDCNPFTGQRYCIEGFVGRAATMQDTVCVEPQERDLIAQENANPQQNRVQPR